MTCPDCRRPLTVESGATVCRPCDAEVAGGAVVGYGLPPREGQR